MPDMRGEVGMYSELRLAPEAEEFAPLFEGDLGVSGRSRRLTRRMGELGLQYEEAGAAGGAVVVGLVGLWRIGGLVSEGGELEHRGEEEWWVLLVGDLDN